MLEELALLHNRSLLILEFRGRFLLLGRGVVGFDYVLKINSLIYYHKYVIILVIMPEFVNPSEQEFPYDPMQIVAENLYAQAFTEPDEVKPTVSFDTYSVEPEIFDESNLGQPDISTPLQELSYEELGEQNRNSKFGKFILGLSKAAFVTKNVLETTSVALEISPANETARYAVFGWVHTATGGNIVASAAAFGLSTFIIEAAAALMAADLLETHTSKKVIEKINELSNRFIKSDSSSKEMSLVARAATAMVFGSAVLVAAKHRKDPERTKRDNQRSGLKTAATMGVYFTGEGLLTGEAVNSFGWAKTAIGGVAVLAYAQHLIKKIADRREQKK